MYYMYYEKCVTVVCVYVKILVKDWFVHVFNPQTFHIAKFFWPSSCPHNALKLKSIPCMGQHHIKQSTTEQVVALTDFGHINQNTTGISVTCILKIVRSLPDLAHIWWTNHLPFQQSASYTRDLSHTCGISPLSIWSFTIDKIFV